MDKETFDAKERARGAKRRAEEKERRIVWRAALHKRQREAKAKAATMLNSSGISDVDWKYLYIANQNKRGPREDQIKHINKLWVKYEFAGEKND